VSVISVSCPFFFLQFHFSGLCFFAARGGVCVSFPILFEQTCPLILHAIPFMMSADCKMVLIIRYEIRLGPREWLSTPPAAARVIISLPDPKA
jgi:hypothetical protein